MELTDIQGKNLISNILNEGYWGHLPLENDSALDEFGEVAYKNIEEQLKNIEKNWGDKLSVFTYLGVIMYMLQIYNFFYSLESLDKKFDFTNKINKAIKYIDDEKFINTWDDPEEVRKYIKKLPDTIKDILDKKANADASNVGKNAKDVNGSTADNSAAWGSALGTGEVESGNEKLVTGATVYEEVRLTEDGEYVKMDNTVAENLTTLDDQARMTAEAVASNAEMITENARNIAQNTLDITTNAQNITKNTQNIASNTENITQNTQDIATNADNIVTAQKTADTAMAGVSMLLVGTGISIEGIIATDQKVNDLAAQDGKITAQGEKADEFTRGATVYEYLNGKPGEEGSLRLGENTTKIAIGRGSEIKSGTRSVALGFDNTVDGDQNIAIGTGHTLKGNNNIVLGNNVQVHRMELKTVKNGRHQSFVI